MLQALVNIPANLRPSSTTASRPQTVGQQKKIKKYGSLANYEIVQAQATATAKIQSEIKSLGLANVTSEADYITKYNSASTEAKKYLESPADLKIRLAGEGYYEAQANYNAELAAYQDAVKEQAEWAQASQLAGKIQLGQGKRYDLRSPVGKKITALLREWESSGQRTAPPQAGEVYFKPEAPPTGAITKEGTLTVDITTPSGIAFMEKQLSTQPQVQPTTQIYGPAEPTQIQRDFYSREVDRTGQTYMPQTGEFIQKTYPSGQGTGILSLPTGNEQIQIDEATHAGSIAGALSIYKERWVEPLAYKGEVAGVKVIPGWNKDKEFQMGQPLAGTYSEENFVNLFKYAEQEVVVPLSEEGTIPIVTNLTGARVAPLGGVGGLPAQAVVGVIVAPAYKATAASLDFYEDKVVSTIAPFVQTEIGGTPNPITVFSRGKQKIDIIAEKNPEAIIAPIIVGSSKSDTTAGRYSQMGLFEFGVKRFSETVGVAWEEASMSKFVGADRKTAGYIGKGAELATEFAPYAIPGYFEGKIGAEVAEAQLGGGIFGGPTSAVEFTKERPVEVAIAGVMVYAHGVSYLAKTLSKTNAVKYEKYLSSKKVEVDNVNRVMKQNEASALRQRLKLDRKLIHGKDLSTKPKLKVKGNVNIKYETPTNTFKGSAQELVQVNGKNILMKSNIKVVVDNSGRVIRTFKYTDGTVKVVTTKGQVITTELFSKGGSKVFFNRKEIPGFIDDMIKHKMKPEKINIKDEIFSDYTIKVTKAKGTQKKIIELTDRTTKEKLIIKTDSKLGKEILSNQKSSVMSGRFDVTGSSDVSRSVSEKGFRGQIARTDKATGDFIAVGDRKAKLIAQFGKDKVAIDSSIGQRIKIGTDKSKDIAFKFAEKGKAVTVKSTSPPGVRALQSSYSQNIMSYQISPAFRGSEKYVKAFKSGKAVAGAGRGGGPNIISIDWQPFNQPSIKGVAKDAVKKAKKGKEFVSDAGKEFGIQIKQTLKKAGVKAKDIKEVSSAYGFKPGTTYVEPSSSFLPSSPSIFSAPSVGPSIDILKGTKQGVALFGLSSAFVGKNIFYDNKLDNKLDTQPDLKVDTQPDLKFDVEPDFKFDNRLDNKTNQISETILFKQPQSVIQTPAIDTDFGGPYIPTPNITQRGVDENEKFPLIVDIRFGGKNKKIEPETQAYFGQVLVKGKYQQVTDKPHTKSGARDAIARIIDNTVSAQGRVVQMEKQPKKGTKFARGDGYYDKNKDKFKGFKMYKGRRVAVKDTIIEKRNKRIDTPGEKRGMTVAQFKSQGSLGRPKGKKKPFRL